MLVLLSQLPYETLEDMIATLLVEEKRTIAGGTKNNLQLEMALYSRNNRSRSTKDKGKMKCLLQENGSHNLE